MKVRLDTCVWGGARSELEEAGHDVIWTGDEWPDPGDRAILARAHEEGQVLVTLDKDFGELAIVYDLPHAGIVRLVGFSARRQGAAILHALETYEAELSAGAIITVELGRVRIRLRDSGNANADGV